MYLNGLHKLGVAAHVLNVLQIVRLLASRGHYSIDIMVGWIVAIYVSNPAEKLGRWYSRASAQDIYDSMEMHSHDDATSMFERIIRADDIRRSTRYGDDDTDEDEDDNEAALREMSLSAAAYGRATAATAADRAATAADRAATTVRTAADRAATTVRRVVHQSLSRD